MSDLISPADRQLLNQYQIKIEVDAANHCGFIVLHDRRMKVTVLTYEVGQENDLQVIDLNEESMRETASKVAVMLLKKREQLQGQLVAPLNLKIDQAGITSLTNQQLIKHEDADVNKNTRPDYDALVSYLDEVDEEEAAAGEQKVQIKLDEVKLVTEKKIKKLKFGKKQRTHKSHALQASSIKRKGRKEHTPAHLSSTPKDKLSKKTREEQIQTLATEEERNPLHQEPVARGAAPVEQGLPISRLRVIEEDPSTSADRGVDQVDQMLKRVARPPLPSDESRGLEEQPRTTPASVSGNAPSLGHRMKFFKGFGDLD